MALNVCLGLKMGDSALPLVPPSLEFVIMENYGISPPPPPSPYVGPCHLPSCLTLMFIICDFQIHNLKKLHLEKVLILIFSTIGHC